MITVIMMGITVTQHTVNDCDVMFRCGARFESPL
jgi:hypothetical protein